MNLNQAVLTTIWRNARWLLCLTALFCSALLTGCTERDPNLEQLLSTKLQKFKDSHEPSMDLSEVLGKNWRKVCVQTPYLIDKSFLNEDGEGNKRHRLNITDNDRVIWVFYNDGSVRATIIHMFQFLAYPGSQNSCTTPKHPRIAVAHFVGNRDGIYFLNTEKQQRQK